MKMKRLKRHVISILMILTMLFQFQLPNIASAEETEFTVTAQRLYDSERNLISGNYENSLEQLKKGFELQYDIHVYDGETVAGKRYELTIPPQLELHGSQDVNKSITFTDQKGDSFEIGFMEYDSGKLFIVFNDSDNLKEQVDMEIYAGVSCWLTDEVIGTSDEIRIALEGSGTVTITIKKEEIPSGLQPTLKKMGSFDPVTRFIK